MISKQRALRAALGLGALTACAALPSAVGDAHLPQWLHVFQKAHFSFSTQWLAATRDELVALLPHWGARTAAPAKDTELTDASPLGPPTEADVLARLGLDPMGLREALTFYRTGDVARGDAVAQAIKDPTVRTALEWTALKSGGHDIRLERVQAFVQAHPGWPGRTWLQRRSEEALLAEHPGGTALESYFAATPPQTIAGKLTLARLLEANGKTAEAGVIVKAIWREGDLNGGLEGRLKTDFGAYLDKADYKFRADRLLYKEQIDAGLRAAALAGPEAVAIARARAAVISEGASDKLLAAVPLAAQNDPGLLFARIQKLRRADKIREAVDILLAAPRDPVLLVNGDEWWVERRLLARKLLDLGDAKTAYRLCAEHSAASNEMKIEAEFHAGWIALRFLNEPGVAAKHFATIAALAETPMSQARAAYWQGRAAEISTADDASAQAEAFYSRAAMQPTTYYGQLARSRLGLDAVPVDTPIRLEAADVPRDEAVRVIELLYAMGENELALPLVVAAAHNFSGDARVAALEDVIARQRDAHLSLVVGKILCHRGLAAERLAFPTYGIPQFEPIEKSAATAVVYAVARQESAFDAKAVSGAGAKGLMQMIVPTARRTAERAGLVFDENRLLSDAAFNARLGAAHLGALLNEQGGSYTLVFAAYNAGGGRVKQWIDAYGDPRTPGVDPIDWVERIPFTETRNYVQRCLENLAIYQARFRNNAPSPQDGALHVDARM